MTPPSWSAVGPLPKRPPTRSDHSARTTRGAPRRERLSPTALQMGGSAFRTVRADDPNEGISLTLWESREDLDAYEQGELYQWMTERARAYYVGEFWVKHFEVRLGEELKR
jgi:heme-degrading monooxygenase HmoA